MEHSRVIILKSVHWLTRSSRLKVFLFLAPVAILFIRVERFEHFGRGSTKEYSCKLILKLGQWPWRRCRFKVFFLFLALAAILYSGTEPFRQFW